MIKIKLSLRNSSISWEPRLMKRRSLVRISHPLLCEHVKKKLNKIKILKYIYINFFFHFFYFFGKGKNPRGGVFLFLKETKGRRWSMLSPTYSLWPESGSRLPGQGNSGGRFQDADTHLLYVCICYIAIMHSLSEKLLASKLFLKIGPCHHLVWLFGM
jgi:hypothetical protein